MTAVARSRSINRDCRMSCKGDRGLGIFTAEILDVDGDVWPDLLLAGHEVLAGHTVEGGVPEWPTTIYWGDPSGTYEDTRKTILPAVEGQGVVVDIDAEDLDGDGDRDIVLNRTSDDPFYEGYFIQIVAALGDRAFADETPTRIEGGADPDGRLVHLDPASGRQPGWSPGHLDR